MAFVGVGDTVELTPQDGFDLKIEGPFAAALEGRNLITEAAEAVKEQHPNTALGRFRLVKMLPVAAGVGGGSADAAAALRLIIRASEGRLSVADVAALAPRLGSDVAVCLSSAPAMITGRGEIVSPVQGFPSCGVVLVNPRVPLATADVYGALSAGPVGDLPEEVAPSFAGDFDKLVDYVIRRANDLEPVATGLAPKVETVLAALRSLEGARLARLSGSGATCFAVFATPREAHRAAAMLAQSEPNWWIAASMLGDPTSS